MARVFGVILIVIGLACQVAADTPVGSEQHPVFDGQLVSESWTITSTTGFSDEAAAYSSVSIDQGSLNFTHSRPSSTSDYTSYATVSETGSTFATGPPNGDYSWSKGPDIIVSDFNFQGLYDMQILEASLAVHIEIPDAMPSDEVMIVFETETEIQLVTTIARTSTPINRFSAPLVYSLGNSSSLNWSLLEGSSVKIDYVSDGAPDDSEVRIDAVGIQVSYYQPWYGFENVKAQTTIIGNQYPVLDFDASEGETTGLSLSNCGLNPSTNLTGEWTIYGIETPYQQALGRIHLFADEGLDASLYIRVDGGEWITWSVGAHLPSLNVLDVSLAIRQGCVSKIRVDVNDPTLVISGEIHGEFDDLVGDLSKLRFAIGSNLAVEYAIQGGPFNLIVPVGEFLPTNNEDLELGLGVRFQWSSDGKPETANVLIHQLKIEGGFTVDIDKSPVCQNPANVNLIEDEGGISIPILSGCSDDRDLPSDLEMTFAPRSNGLLDLDRSGSDLLITPLKDSSGTTVVDLQVRDSGGNTWSGSFVVSVEEVSDPPFIGGIPTTISAELGETTIIPISIQDPDSNQLSITTSRSWAVIEGGNLVIEPILPGPAQLIITVGDGILFTELELEILVRALPELSISSVTSQDNDLSEDIDPGLLMDLVFIVENNGKGTAFDIDVSCRVNDVLYETNRIPIIPAETLVEAFCSVPAPTEEGPFRITLEITSKEQIISDNSQLIYEVISFVDDPDEDSGLVLSENWIIILLVIGFITLVSIAMLMGPNRIRKPYE
ncbi:MAG: hypothetical protein VYD21_01500 [Candidatus Thermoplasmatota archaeon]|nr:hypothetical protein [Candidatus Thermoplasmatota archaeon]